MSLTKSDIKLIKSLSNKKYREQHSLFVIEGEKLIDEARKSGIKIVKEYKREEIGQEMMSRISSLSSPSPALAIAEKPFSPPFKEPSSNNLYIALDSIKDPGNLGTILRVCEWFGVRSLYLSYNCVDLYNPKVVNSAMGSLFRVNTFIIELEELIKMAKKEVEVFGAFTEGESIYSCNLPKGGLVVMGSESHGISLELSHLIERRLTIPSFDSSKNIDSLNVATATAVICSHFRAPFA